MKAAPGSGSRRRGASVRLAPLVVLLALPLAGCRSTVDLAHVAARRPPLSPCQVEGTDERLLCGTYTVPEDRWADPARSAQSGQSGQSAGQAKGGRTIDLRVVVVPARAARPEPDAIFFFVGGPGGSATRRAPWHVDDPLRERRDLVFVDQRGTGGSNPLSCDLGAGGEGEPGELREIFPVEDVVACRESLSARADVRLYTTALAVDDIDEVRRWLGYERIDLVGGSYASVTVQTYLQRHPEAVRAAFSQAIISLEGSAIRDQARNAQETLDALLDACAADPGCGGAFPELRRELAELLERLERQPAPVAVTDPVTGEELRFDLRRDYLAEHLRRSLYFLDLARGLPMAIHLAHGGGDGIDGGAPDYGPLTAMALLFDHGYGGISDGMLLTVYCTEQMGTFDLDRALAEAETTVFGSFRLRQQIQACEHWPVGPLPEGFHSPRTVDVPTLLVSGELDPINPARYGEAALAHLSRGRHLIVPEAHHGLSGLVHAECVLGLQREFLERGSADGLDTSCLRTIHRQPFVTDREELDRILAEE